MKELDTIVPGKQIGNLKLGEKIDDSLDTLPDDFTITTLKELLLYDFNSVKVWVEKGSHRIIQIGVTKGFQGSFLSKITIGSTLTDLGNFVGEWYEYQDTYRLKDFLGICFELKDIEDWEEQTAPIESIYVF